MITPEPNAVHRLSQTDIDKPKWTIRRSLVMVILLWCACIITYLTVAGESDELREAIATSVLLLMGMVISTYVLGVVWNDMSFLKNTGGQRYRDSMYGGGGYGYDPYGYPEPGAGGTDQPPPGPRDGRMGE